ncbi:MAG TPA: Trk system potassium transporter TrkA [Cryomorphaceae bacterium]|nr:Trk system potassium transporter TrkA [Cryomorphaceae bacterium]
MKVIIAGAGEVGFHLAKLLTMEGHALTVIDKEPDALHQISQHLDLEVIEGSSTSIGLLTNAKVQKADLVIGVTNSEDVNITTCIIAKHLGAKRTVARISNVEFLTSKEKLDMAQIGIDELISPASLAAREIKRLCKESALTDFIDFDKGKLSLMGLKVEHDSLVAGKTIEELAPLNADKNFITVAILRNNETIVPKKDTRFLINDHAYFCANPEGLDRVLEIFKKDRLEIKHIMILGGSAVGYHAAKALSKQYRVKLVEHVKERCIKLAEQLPDTLIINADGRNVDILEEENLSEMDAFIAVTGNSETNIITSLVAKNHGVDKTIALVENIDYIHLSQSIGVDTLINKKLIAANFIFRYIRQGEVLSLTSLHGADVEVLEFEVPPNAKIIGKTIGDLKFPKNAVVGGVVRDGVGRIPDSNFEFAEKDHIVVLSKMQCIHKVEKYFK